MTEQLRSWWEEKYPPHECPKCKLEHTRIPNIQQRDITWLPLELVAVVDGPVHPGRVGQPGMDTPAHIFGLLWGLPGGERPLIQTIQFMN